MSSKYAVQYVNFTNSGPYICYPKVSDNDRTWDGRKVEGFAWELTEGTNVTVDLFKDAGFSEGDLITTGIDTVAGADASNPTILVVSANNKTASFDSTGSSGNTHLNYQGIKG